MPARDGCRASPRICLKQRLRSSYARTWLTLVPAQAQKFGGDQQPEFSDDELGEDSVLLESPLDKLEPYQIFRSALMSKLPCLTELFVRGL